MPSAGIRQRLRLRQSNDERKESGAAPLIRLKRILGPFLTRRVTDSSARQVLLQVIQSRIIGTKVLVKANTQGKNRPNKREAQAYREMEQGSVIPR